MVAGRCAGGRQLQALITGLLQAHYELIAVEPDSWGGPMRIYRLKASH